MVTRSEPRTEYLEQKSEITGDRAFIPRGTHWAVEVKYHLYKHTTSPTPQTKYETIASYKGIPVTLYLHNDGPQFLHSASADALFVLKELTPFYLTTTDYKDGLLLLFESIMTIDQEEIARLGQ
jgi:hypothetical protein